LLHAQRERFQPAFWQYVQKNAQDEYAGVKPLWVHTNDGSSFHLTSAKGVKTMEDLKGLKIRSATRLNSKMLAALGATPVQMPLPAVPEAMAKGVIDGAMVPWEGVPQAKLQEVAKSHLDMPAGQPKFANSIFAFVMNQAKYDSLPADLKKVIDNNSGVEASGLAGEKFDNVVVPYHKLATDRGNQVVALAPAEIARWTKATADIDDQWVKSLGQGRQRRALLEQAQLPNSTTSEQGGRRCGNGIQGDGWHIDVRARRRTSRSSQSFAWCDRCATMTRR
jgi:TRAP-type C4-dicarboxylate transport system substrate-binding protein